MPKCSVMGCGLKYSKKEPLLSLHKLPKNENLKRKWLESLGEQKIDFSHGQVYVCSLHFDESCINRALGIVRLKGNAIPTRLPKDYLEVCRVPLSATTINVMSKSKHEDYIMTSYQEQFEKKKTSTAVDKGDFRSGHKNIEHICINGPEAIQPQKSITTIPDLKNLQKLKEKCGQQQKKIKRLNEKCRRQAKKLDDFNNFIQDLKNKNLINNEGIITIEDCSGLKKVGRAASRDFPLGRQFMEEIRKFALSVRFLSPTAYNFIRHNRLEYETSAIKN